MNSKQTKYVKNIVFISLQGLTHSRTKNYYQGLKNLGLTCQWLEIPNKGILKNLKNIIRENTTTQSILVVASPSHLLVPFTFLALRSRPYFDAGWLLYDGVIVSRKSFGFFGLKFLKTLIIDIAAILLAKKMFVESNQQKKRISRFAFWKSDEIIFIPTGFEESRFKKINPVIQTNKKFVVLFRGGDLNEAGIDVLITAIKLNTNNNIEFIIISNSKRFQAITLPNTKFVYNYIPDNKLNEYFNSANIVLGQLAFHKRTRWTIPHKFYEAAFFGLPYLTSDSTLMTEFKEMKCVETFRAGDSVSLLNAIENLFSNSAKCKLIGSNLENLYIQEFSQMHIAQKLLQHLY